MNNKQKLKHAINFLSTIDSQDEQMLRVIRDLESVLRDIRK